MADQNAGPTGPDLTQGVALSEFKDDKLVGHVDDKDVLLVRRESEIFAVGAHCSHYHGPLVDGLVVGDTVRCPWHHACFDLRTGEAVRAPAFHALQTWQVEQRDGRVFVKATRPAPARRPAPAKSPGRIVIVGGGAAGFAAAELLRREGYANEIVMLSEDPSPPVDRPNLSKDYLAGSAPEEWVPLQPDTFYADNGIALRLGSKVTAIDPKAHTVSLGSETVKYDKLLLATGAAPVRLKFPGADLPHVHTLRTLADSRAIIAGAGDAKRALVIGASFIGLEVAASLRARGIEVHVVAPEARPMEKILGPQLGDFIRKLHEEHGVVFHLENGVQSIAGRTATLNKGSLDADLVVMGVGVRPRLELAEAAGLRVDKGVIVDRELATSAPDVYAAGDIARWPDPYSGEDIRVEHWVVAERQGQTAARNLLGRHEAYDAVPFFWSQHYDVPINYVGHAAGWDELEVEGDVAARDCVIRYRKGGRTRAVSSIYRDVDSLREEVAMEKASVRTPQPA